MALQNKECLYVMVYMLRNYSEQLPEIAKVVCKKISEVKAE